MIDKKIKVDLNKNLKKDAKISLEKKEFPDGHVYAYVNGVKQFFSISKVFIDVYGKSVEELINEIKKQREINKTQKTINETLLKKIKKIESKVDKYVG
jgi:hypothetical protein